MAELDRLQRRLDQVNTSLALFDRPVRFLFLNGGIYVLLPTLMLLAAHYLVIMKLDAPQLYLRIASVIIPLPFGMAAFAFSRIGYRGAFGLGVLIGRAQCVRHAFGRILCRWNTDRAGDVSRVAGNGRIWAQHRAQLPHRQYSGDSGAVDAAEHHCVRRKT